MRIDLTYHEIQWDPCAKSLGMDGFHCVDNVRHKYMDQQSVHMYAGTFVKSPSQDDTRHSDLSTFDDVVWQRQQAQASLLATSSRVRTGA